VTLRFAGLLLVVAILPHAPFLAGGCMTDDFVHLAQLQDHPSLAAILAGPDRAGFFRPAVHTSLLLNAAIAGYDCGTAYRVVNLLLHALAVLLGAAVATRVLGSARAGLLTALMFSLAPKATTITVFWISARGDLLMSVFVFLGVLAWMRWAQEGSSAIVAMVGVCYTLALLSKEAAVLMPGLLLLLPAIRPWRQRVAAAAAISLGLAIVAFLQSRAQAVLAAFEPPEFALSLSPVRWIRNFWSYLTRAVPVAALFVAASAVAARSGPALATAARSSDMLRVYVLGAAWFAAFIAPALPLPLRSELRLYLPAFGLALIGGALVDRLLDQRRAVRGAVVAVAALLAVYQAARSFEAGRDVRFSRSFVEALAASRALHDHRGPIAIVPADDSTEQRLRDTLGGYGPSVIPRVLGRSDVTGDIVSVGASVPSGWLVVRTAEVDGRVEVTPASQ
jgi:hypothetical protein